MKLSRHLRNNLRLYGITEKDIIETIGTPDYKDKEGDRLVALKKFARRFSGYPLKVVYKRDGSKIMVITAYPLKRKNWR